MRDLDHPNILKLHTIFETESHIHFILDLYASLCSYYVFVSVALVLWLRLSLLTTSLSHIHSLEAASLLSNVSRPTSSLVPRRIAFSLLLSVYDMCILSLTAIVQYVWRRAIPTDCTSRKVLRERCTIHCAADTGSKQ